MNELISSFALSRLGVSSRWGFRKLLSRPREPPPPRLDGMYGLSGKRCRPGLFHGQLPQMRRTALGAGEARRRWLGIGRDDRYVEDGAMATLWSCPKSDCPPTEIAPVDVPESGEAAGAESERPFTTDEVAALLNVPP